MKILHLTFLLSLVTLTYTTHAQQNNEKAAKQIYVADIVRNKNFSFVARTISKRNEDDNPVQFFSYVKVADNAISTDLYLDRKFRGYPNSIPDNFLKSASSDFTYVVKEKKPNSFKINITPKGHTLLKNLELNIATDGEARAYVLLTNGEIINYTGYITDASMHAELVNN